MLFNDESNPIKKYKIDISHYINNVKDALKTNNYIEAKNNIDIIIKIDPLNIDAQLFLSYIFTSI
jgi:Tfp pilus assembly protein PilF